MHIKFADCELNCGARTLVRDGSQIDVEPQVFDIIQYFVDNPGRVISKDELLSSIWSGRIVSESTISSRLSAVRRAIGDNDPNNRIITTVAGHGYRFNANAPEERVAESSSSTGYSESTVHRDVRYVVTKDGISLAISEVGSGFPVVKVSNWMSHIETDFDNPLWSRLLTTLSVNSRLIRYDGRGIGLSDRRVPEDKITFENFVLDLEAVVDSLNVDRVSLLGISMGAATALAFASRRPEKVHRLVLHGGFVTGRRRRNSVEDAERASLFLALMRQGWGTTNEPFMKAFAQIYLPSASLDELKWFARLQQQNASPEVAVNIRAACDDIDVAGTLSGIHHPTLITHCRGDMVVPFEQSRIIASGLVNAHVQIFESQNHIILDRECESDRFARTVAQFFSGWKQ